MPDTDLPTLQQRVERVLDEARQEYANWSPNMIALLLITMNDAFADDGETEIAHAASRWLRKVNR